MKTPRCGTVVSRNDLTRVTSQNSWIVNSQQQHISCLTLDFLHLTELFRSKTVKSPFTPLFISYYSYTSLGNPFDFAISIQPESNFHCLSCVHFCSIWDDFSSLLIVPPRSPFPTHNLFSQHQPVILKKLSQTILFSVAYFTLDKGQRPYNNL